MWDWTFVGIYERWNNNERIDILANLSIASSHMAYNPESVSRVICAVQELLDTELAGKISTKELVVATQPSALFTEKELANTDDLFAKSMWFSRSQKNSGIPQLSRKI